MHTAAAQSSNPLNAEGAKGAEILRFSCLSSRSPRPPRSKGLACSSNSLSRPPNPVTTAQRGSWARDFGRGFFVPSHLVIRKNGLCARPRAADLKRSKKDDHMDLLKLYFERAAEITGERTSGEKKYDREVMRWIEKGKSIKKAIAKANEKYPAEALAPDDAMLPDLLARYEFLIEHERIERRL